MSLCILSVQYLESGGLDRSTGVCTVPGCGVPLVDIDSTLSSSSHLRHLLPWTSERCRSWLVREDFLLSEVEVDEFIRLSSVQMGAETAGALLVEPPIRHMLAMHCHGHISALSMSVRQIVDRFHHNTAVTVEVLPVARHDLLLYAMLQLWRGLPVQTNASVSGEASDNGAALRPTRRESRRVQSTGPVGSARRDRRRSGNVRLP